jgi:DHA1 family tetracycline resistance protein-like MFS transporter
MRQDGQGGKSKIAFIFLTILLDAMGVGIIIPVMPDILRRFISDPTKVSEYFGYFIGAYAVMQFIASPVLGTLADRFGRKSILLASLFGAGVDYLIMALAPSLWVLAIGRAVSGLTGASMTVATSYIADISTEDNRSANFGVIGAGWGIGFIAGPLIGGLLGSLGPTAPFIAAAVMNLLNFIFGIFVLPESLAPEHRRKIDLKAMNPLASLLKLLRRKEIFLLVWISFLINLAGLVHPVNWTLYTQTKFGWTAWEVGLSLSFVGAVIAICQVTLTRWVIPRIGEERSLTVGLVVYVFAFILFGLATQGWMMYAILAFFGFSGLAMPALQSIVSRSVPSNEQGELQGSLVSLASLASIVAPFLFTYLFVKFTRPDSPVYFPGAAYVLAGLICLVALFNWLCRDKKSPRS